MTTTSKETELDLFATRDDEAETPEPAPKPQRLALEGIALAVTEKTRCGVQPSMFGGLNAALRPV